VDFLKLFKETFGKTPNEFLDEHIGQYVCTPTSINHKSEFNKIH